MKVKELKELLNQYPDDMEVMQDNEVGGPHPLQPPEVEELVLMHTLDMSGKATNFTHWYYQTVYTKHRDILEKDKKLVFRWY